MSASRRTATALLGLPLCALALVGARVVVAGARTAGDAPPQHLISRRAGACRQHRTRNRTDRGDCAPAPRLATRHARHRKHRRHPRKHGTPAPTVVSGSTDAGDSSGSSSGGGSGSGASGAATALGVPGGSAPAGAGGGQTTTPTEAPPAEVPASGPARVQVIAKEYSFTLSRTEVPAGKVIVEFVDGGEDPHNLHLEEPSQAGEAGAFPTSLPGFHGDLTLNLHPGTYTLFCSLPGHEAKGMKATLTVN
ncbi:MAG TPA: plastocyanin/azurin family copper-binding protein [Solirubrobacteraceae bacterium]|jgi:plastocyanin|nr:plastocyanin/azurin family copper-binding protein [Solirubrobacteraceae bacterium]